MKPTSSEDELQHRFNQMTFVVATKKLEQLPHWVKVSEVFKADSDAPFLKRAGMRVSTIPATKNTASASHGCAAFANTSTEWTCWSARCPTTK